MRVLVVGDGAREHAIAWKLDQQNRRIDLYIAPGNAGTSEIGENVPISPTDISGLARFVRDNDIRFTVVGPEDALAAGIVNRFLDIGFPIFGPTAQAAIIETNKYEAKLLMREAGVPTASWKYFRSLTLAKQHVAIAVPSLVIKEIGLARGKGVLVTSDRQEAIAWLDTRIEKIFKEGILFEEYLVGQEISVFAFVHGEQVSQLFAACDYKHLEDNDQGPMTGGMGGYSPPSIWTPQLDQQIRETIMEPLARALVARGTLFVGVLYAGLMLTDKGPIVLEFNARFGDPETQVILPRLKSDLLEAMMLTVEGRVGEIVLEWEFGVCVGVVLATEGYPLNPVSGDVVKGLERCPSNILVFHAGTRRAGDYVETTGGRILTVVALRKTLGKAITDCYRGVRAIDVRGARHRKDIAHIA